MDVLQSAGIQRVGLAVRNGGNNSSSGNP